MSPFWILLQAILFYGSRFDEYNLPLPRVRKNGSKPIWALLHEESPKNAPILLHDEVLSLFDVVSSYSRYSDVQPLTLNYLPSLEAITGKRQIPAPADHPCNVLSRRIERSIGERTLQSMSC